MLDLPQQHTVVIHLRSDFQAEGAAGAVALVLAAQGQVGLWGREGDGRRRQDDDGTNRTNLKSQLNSHSSDRCCSAASAASAPGSGPALAPAPSAAAPGWPAARRCACAAGSCPAGSRCTPAAGCPDCAEPWRGSVKGVGWGNKKQKVINMVWGTNFHLVKN